MKELIKLPNAKIIRNTFFLWATLFSGFWTILSPLGGMSFLQDIASQKWYIYLNIAILLFLLVTVKNVLIYVNKDELDPLFLDISRSKYNYLSLLSHSKEEIYLLGISLPTFSLESKVDFLRKKVIDGVRIRILLLNPFSPAVLHRPKRLYQVGMEIQETIVITLSVLIKLWKSLNETDREKLQIGLINIHPSIGIIGNETQIFWSPYLSTSTGAKSPFLVHSLKSAFAKEILLHFNTLWEKDALLINNEVSIDDLINFVKEDYLAPIDVSEDVRIKLCQIFPVSKTN